MASYYIQRGPGPRLLEPHPPKRGRVRVIGALILVGIGVIVAVVVADSGEPSSTALEQAAAACRIGTVTSGVEIGDDGRTMTIDGSANDSEVWRASIDEIACLLGELDTPDAVISRMDGTRALDGRQDAEWEDFTASWTYHPDDGLDLIVEMAS